MIVEFGLLVRLADAIIGFHEELLESFGVSERRALVPLREFLVAGFVLRIRRCLYSIHGMDLASAKRLA